SNSAGVVGAESNFALRLDRNDEILVRSGLDSRDFATRRTENTPERSGISATLMSNITASRQKERIDSERVDGLARTPLCVQPERFWSAEVIAADFEAQLAQYV